MPMGFARGAANSTQLSFFELETCMKATEQLHHMGQSLWLDNITRGLLNKRHARTLHPRTVNQRTHLKSEYLR